MNILYIGPYSTHGIVGYSSIDIIDCLNKAEKVSDLTIRPVYIGDLTNNKTFVTNNLSSKTLKESYDIIIQHAPIDMLAYTGDLCKKTIAIPLFSRIINSKKYADIMNSFDSILVDDEGYSRFLTEKYNIKNVDTFSYSKLYNQNTQHINFPDINDTIKLYSILENYDEELLEKLLVYFYYGFGTNNGISLCIIIDDSNMNINKNIQQLLTSIKQKINYVSNIDNIRIFSKKHSINELCSIHKTCDIYIDIVSSNHASKLNRYIARQFDNPCVIDDDIVSDIIPSIKNNNNIGEYKEYHSYHNMIKHLINAINQKDKPLTNITSNKNISEIICQ